MRITSVKSLDRIGGAVVLGILVGGMVLIVSLGIRRHARVGDKTARIEEKTREVDAARRQRDKLFDQLAAWEEETTRLNRRLKRNVDIGGFLAQVDSLARGLGITQIDLQPNPPVEEDAHRRRPFVLSCNGSFAELHRLVHELETTEDVIRIDAVTMNQGAVDRPCYMELQASLYEK